MASLIPALPSVCNGMGRAAAEFRPGRIRFLITLETLARPRSFDRFMSASANPKDTYYRPKPVLRGIFCAHWSYHSVMSLADSLNQIPDAGNTSRPNVDAVLDLGVDVDLDIPFFRSVERSPLWQQIVESGEVSWC
jgi:hypothetical protein